MDLFENHGMEMRKFVYSLVLLLSVFSFLALGAKQPNVLFIAVDDMNDWIGPLGGLGIAKTPNLDRLAAESTTFTNAHCASPACASSRLANMTGVQPSKSGVMQNVWYDGPKWREIPMLEKIETVEQFFKNRGYETLAGGKIYHSLAPPWLTSNQADPDGWDFYYPSVSVPMPHQISAPEKVINPDSFKGGRLKWFTWGPIQAADEKMADHQTVGWASYELKRSREKPLYLACGIFRPHMPWEVPQKYFDLYPLDEIPDLEILENDLEDALVHARRGWHKFVLENKEWKHVIQAYLASISFADAQVGRLLDALEESGKADETIVVLWSDHGMHIGEKENWEKFTLWEEATRVPFFVKAPGVTKPGSVVSQAVSLLDLYPTLVDLAGFEIPDHCDGASVVPLLEDPNAEREHSALTSFTYPGNKTGHALRGNRYRYIYYEWNSLEELYDHDSDPNEFTNLAYDPTLAGVIEQFRNEMVSRVSRVSVDEMLERPSGYTVSNGRVSVDGFIPMAQVPLPKERPKKESIR
jgi:arylsulfatase A-like enzyme|tara:strand:- start:383 stop:1960 length:1578 start_codon:yes stop_codon:yes gene_type:complete